MALKGLIKVPAGDTSSPPVRVSKVSERLLNLVKKYMSSDYRPNLFDGCDEEAIKKVCYTLSEPAKEEDKRELLEDFLRSAGEKELEVLRVMGSLAREHEGAVKSVELGFLHMVREIQSGSETREETEWD